MSTVNFISFFVSYYIVSSNKSKKSSNCNGHIQSHAHAITICQTDFLTSHHHPLTEIKRQNVSMSFYISFFRFSFILIFPSVFITLTDNNGLTNIY